MKKWLFLSAAALALSGQAPAPAPTPKTPGEIILGVPDSAWKPIADNDLMILTIAAGQVVIQLEPNFAPIHTANMRALARAHWWDGTDIYRVQDNYVVQWGDRSEKKPLPATGIIAKPPEEYGRRASGLRVTRLPSPDSYARVTGFVDGWPVAGNGSLLWPTHCYGAVGVGRDLAPDAGTGAELYAVLGAARQLDRNIALVGRVIEGMELLSSLPRGTEPQGFYGPKQTATPIVSVRLASDLPAGQRPAFEVMDTNNEYFDAYARIKANRSDDFYKVGHGGVDICSVPVPVRRRKAG